jgi:uncharacterized membrane protein YccC
MPVSDAFIRRARTDEPAARRAAAWALGGVRRLGHSVAVASGARAALAACAAYALATLVRLEQPMWAPVSALIVLQGSTRGTLRAMADRLLGTLAGAVAAVVVAVTLAPLGTPTIAQIAIAVALVAAAVATFRPAARAATWTSVIVLMSTIAPGHAVTNATWRIAGVAIGAVVATAIGVLLPPPPVDRRLRSELGAALVAMADALRRAPGGAEPVGAAGAAEDALRRCEALCSEAHPRARPESASLVEPMRRLWHSLVTVNRLAAPVRGDAGVAVNAVVEEATSMLARHLDALADALDGIGDAPDPATLVDIVDAVAAAVRGLRTDGVMRRLTDGEAQAVYLRRFALERAVRDVADVTSRAVAAA